jgi:hypothetical protein
MLFGNPLVMLAVGAAFLWTGYLWLVGRGDGVTAFALLIAASYCAKANDSQEKYRQWKREWDIMSGKAATPAFSLRALRIPAAIGLWLIFAAAAAQMMNDPEQRWAALLFWAGSALGLINMLRLAAKRRAPARRRDNSVSLCLRVPGRSPAIPRAQAALPDYCQRLIGGR